MSTTGGNGLHDRLRSKGISFRASVAGLITTVILALSLALGINNYINTSNAIKELSDHLFAQLMARVHDVTSAHFAAAAPLTAINTSLIQQGKLHTDDWLELGDHFAAMVANEPWYSSAGFADMSGNMILAVHQNDQTRVRQWTSNDEATSSSTLTVYQITSNREWQMGSTTETDFDPRQRDWFKQAAGNKTAGWSAPYIFFTDKTPGLTYSAPLTDTSGTLVGVLSLEMTLGFLSDFVRTLEISPQGYAVVVTDTGDIVAHPDATLFAGAAIPNILDQDQSPAMALWAAYQNNHVAGSSAKWTHSTQSADETWLGTVRPLTLPDGTVWHAILVAPESDFLAHITESNWRALIIGLAILLVALIIAQIFSRQVAATFSQVHKDMDMIRRFDLSERPPIRSVIREIDHMGRDISSMRAGLRSFEKFVPKGLVQSWLEQESIAAPGGTRRTITLFFSDIEGFTSISERMDPDMVADTLNDYLETVSSAIRANNGTVDKYMGDGVMAFWGAPHDNDDHVADACRVALMMNRALDELNDRFEQHGGPRLVTRIGLNTGDCFVGNIGSSERLNYTAIGDAANLASRLEGQNKTYGTNIMISEETYDLVRDQFLARPIDFIAVKGRTGGTIVYELVATLEDASPDQQAQAARQAEALKFYINGEFEAALTAYEALLADYPEDKAIRVMTDRCRIILADPPAPETWDGIHRATSK